MATFKYAFIWKIMEKYQLEYISIIDSEFTCILCEKILKNARSNICGCRYCYECINNYINAGNTCCPGPNSDCREQIINYSTDIQIDHVINKKIINLKFKCPFELCDARCNFLTFVEHEESHINQLNCTEHIDKENIYEDFDLSDKLAVSHNLKSSIEAENNSFLNSIDINNIVSTINKLQSTFMHFQQATDRISIELGKLKEENKMIKDFVFNLSITEETKDKQLNSKKFEKIERSKSKKLLTESKQDKNIDKSNCRIIRWAINNFSLKRNSAKSGKDICISSEKFYTYKKGYRICFCVWPNGVDQAENKFLSVGVCLVKGKYDKKLNWPMKNKISISLVDQSTNGIYLQSDYSYDKANECEKKRYTRPCKRNASIGTIRFVDFNLLYNEQFILLDRIILEFCIKFD